MNDDLGGMSQEMLLGYFKALFCTERKDEKLQSLVWILA
jgi:hypothetical protein